MELDAHIYRKTEIVGTSKESVEDAIRNGLLRARKTLRHLDWFEVDEVRGFLGGDMQECCHYQVTMKVGFRLEEPDEGIEDGWAHVGQGTRVPEEA
jgi:flavin-binding protein dodecin